MPVNYLARPFDDEVIALLSSLRRSDRGITHRAHRSDLFHAVRKVQNASTHVYRFVSVQLFPTLRHELLRAVLDAATGAEIGRIEDVQFGAGEAPLLVVRSGAKERLVPFAAAYLKSVEPAQKRIEVLLPDGMLELDAPLTAEEKARQRRS